jgi:hypothetical protein
VEVTSDTEVERLLHDLLDSDDDSSQAEQTNTTSSSQPTVFLSPDRAWTKQSSVLSDNEDGDSDSGTSDHNENWKTKKASTALNLPRRVRPEDEKLQRPYSEYYDKAAGDSNRRKKSSDDPVNNQTRNRITVNLRGIEKDNADVSRIQERRVPTAPTPPHVGVQCVDSAWMSSTDIHARLVDVLNSTLSGMHFLEWNTNFCHFDAVLMLQLVSYCELGAAYWEKKDCSTIRAQSYHERKLLDLLLTFGVYPAHQMQALRNAWMWEALNKEPGQGPMYGEGIDALVHMYPVGCKADEYHSVKVNRKFVFKTTCVNHSLVGSDMTGCLKAESETRRVSKGVARLVRVHTLQHAVNNAFQNNTGDDFKCRQSIRGVKNSTCPGIYTVRVETATVGALLCIDLEPPFTVDVRKAADEELCIGSLQYKLVGMALWNRRHYICRFRVLRQGRATWYEYDDLQARRNIKILSEPFIYAAGWVPRALWYTRTSNRSQPMETAL